MDSSEISEIRKQIENVASYWDSHQFSKAKELFAETVEIDYRSLGAPEVTQDPVDRLEKNWKAVLLGFDLTAHHIDSF